MTKAPITQALEALNVSKDKQHTLGVYEFTYEEVTALRKALKDLQAWVNDVPEIGSIEVLIMNNMQKPSFCVEQRNVGKAAKHLLKGIEDE